MRTIHVLRKPCSEPTVAANVLKHGTGGLNVDGCRVGTEKVQVNNYPAGFDPKGNLNGLSQAGNAYESRTSSGRWPANVILEEGPAPEALDRQSGILKSAVAVEIKTSPVHGQFVSNARTVPGVNQHGGEGGASRFFQHVKIKG